MGARVSLVRSGLAGLGRFVFLTSAICVGMIIAISGPPTPSETASLGSAVGHVVRRFDSEALHFTFDLCESVPVAAHAAGLCARPEAAVARAEPRGRELQVSAVSETLPPSAREILPPDTIDQIASAAPTHRSELLGEGRRAPRVAHARSPRAGAPRARSLRASARRSTQGPDAHLRREVARTRAVRAAAHRGVAPVRSLHRTPIAALHAQQASSSTRPGPARPPLQRSRARPPAAAGAAETAPPPEPGPPAPEEQANVAPDQQSPAPVEQSDEDSQPNNPQSDEPPAPDSKT